MKASKTKPTPEPAEIPENPKIVDSETKPPIDDTTPQNGDIITIPAGTVELIDETVEIAEDLDEQNEEDLDDDGTLEEDPEAKTHMTQEELDDPDIEEVTRERHLERDMTQDEKLEVGIRMASCLEEAAELEVTKKEYDDRMKKAIEAQYSEATTLAHALKRGRREGNVAIRILKNWHTGSIIVTRMDDNTILEERAMTFDERQRGMFAGKMTAEVAPEVAPEAAPSGASDAGPKEEVQLFEDPPGPADMLAQTAAEPVGHA